MITLKEIQEMVSEKGLGSRIGRFRTLRTKQRIDLKFYNLTYEVQIHEEFRKIKLPTARQMIDTAMAHLPLSKPVIEVIPFKDTDPIRKKAISQQDYFEALLRWYMQQAENVVHSAAKDIFGLGEAYIKSVWDDSLIGASTGDEREILMLERMPLRLLCPHPMCCHPHPDHIDGHPVDMIEVYTVLAEQVRRAFPKWKSNAQNNAPVKFGEYWSADAVCYLADGKPIFEEGVKENDYGMVPYTHVYSGYGHRDANNLPEHKAVSLIRHAIHIIEQQCRYHSYLDKATAFASMPIIELPGVRADYEEGGKVAPKSPKPGMITYRGEAEGEGAKVVWAAPNLPAGIMNAIGVTEALLGKVQPGVVRGEAPRGMEAGYPMALMIGEARLQFGLPLQNLEVLFSRALEQVRHLIRDVVKEGVPIWGEGKIIKLTPDDCDGAFRVNVTFDSTTPESRATRALAGQRLRQGGSISLETELREYHNNKNPKKEINRMRAESIAKHPAIERLVAVNAVRAIEGEKAALAVQQAMGEGEAGAIRKAESTGTPVGGKTEAELPEDVLAQAMGRRGRATRGEVEAEQ